MGEEKKDHWTIVGVRLTDGRTVRYRGVPTEATRCRTIAEDGGVEVWMLAVYGAEEMKPADRFFFDRHNDGHDYMVPVTRRAAWQEWKDAPEGDERAWDAPAFARALGGSPSAWTFTHPQEAVHD